MTRAYAYREGRADGVRWAERDMTDGNGLRAHTEALLRANYQSAYSEEARAYALGCARANRDTWARWDAGTLTWEMLEHAPLRAEA